MFQMTRSSHYLDGDPYRDRRRRRTEEKNREKEKEAFQICLEKIRKHGLEMKLINAEYTFDNNKVLFYFTADGRIDFGNW